MSYLCAYRSKTLQRIGRYTKLARTHYYDFSPRRSNTEIPGTGNISDLLCSLKSCSKSKDLLTGRKIHAQAIENKQASNIHVANSLVNMYAKCGSLIDAKSIFDSMNHRNVVSWNTIIQGCAANNESELALRLYQSMTPENRTSRTYIAALMACIGSAMKENGQLIDGVTAKLWSLETGMSIHSEAARQKCLDSSIFLANSLIDMYMKCGSQVDARLVFDRMAFHDVVSWTSVILGYVENGDPEIALKLFEEMQMDPDGQLYAAALIACGSLAALDSGRRIHDRIRRQGLESEGFLSNCLVDFYGKCGSMGEAMQVFKSMRRRNLVTWSSLIAGYARVGDTSSVLELFQEMREEGFQPDGVTFLSVLSACSHAGLVEKAKEFFEAMVCQYGIKARIEHYHSMIDILGRCNRIEEAVAMVKSMPFAATTVTWNTVLGACWKWKNVEVGRVAFESSLRADEKQELPYVLMANVYRSAGMVVEQSDVLRELNRRAAELSFV